MSWMPAFHYWWIDSQMAATILLLLAWLICTQLREPIQRVKVIRLTMLAILVFMILAALPGWPRLRLGVLPQTVAMERPVQDPLPVVAVVPTQVPAIDMDSVELARPKLAAGPADPSPTPPDKSWSPLLLSVVKWVYWVVTLTLIGWLLIGLVLMRWLRQGSRPAPDRVQRLLKRIPDRPIHCPIAIGISARIEQPLAFGFCQPMILLPEHLIETGTDNEILSALSHEWCHIRRWDLWSKVINRWLFAWYFCNPCFWWLSRRLHLDQEILADRDASVIVTPVEYAAILLRWARRRVTSAPGLANSISLQARVLKQRILVLLDHGPVESKVRPCWNLSATSLALSVALLFSFYSLQSAPLNLDHASIVTATPKAFRYEFPNGMVVELVEVRSDADERWRPDGNDLITSVSQGELDSLSASDSRCATRELLLRVYHPDRNANVLSSVMTNGVQTYLSSSLADSGDVQARVFRVPLPAGRDTANIRLAFESGPWRHYLSSGCGGFRQEQDAFSICGDSTDQTLVTVGHDRPERAMRILAVDQLGTQHSSSFVRFDNKQLTATFDGLPHQQVQEFVLQTRPVTYVEFRNISLRAGEKSDVQMSVAKPPAERREYRST